MWQCFLQAVDIALRVKLLHSNLAIVHIATRWPRNESRHFYRKRANWTFISILLVLASFFLFLFYSYSIWPTCWHTNIYLVFFINIWNPLGITHLQELPTPVDGIYTDWLAVSGHCQSFWWSRFLCIRAYHYELLDNVHMIILGKE